RLINDPLPRDKFSLARLFEQAIDALHLVLRHRGDQSGGEEFVADTATCDRLRSFGLDAHCLHQAEGSLRHAAATLFGTGFKILGGHDAAPCFVRSRKPGMGPGSTGGAGLPMRSRNSSNSPDSLMNLPVACSSDSRRAAFSLRRSSISLRRPVFSISWRRFAFRSSSISASLRAISPALVAPMSSLAGGSGCPISARMRLAQAPRTACTSAAGAACGFVVGLLGLLAGCSRPLLSRRVSNLDTSPLASISARTVPTVVGLTFTVSAICRSDFSGVALISLAMRSRFCSAVRWRRWMLALMT